MAQIRNISKTKIVDLDQYVSHKTFKLGMRDRSYKLPPREFTKILEQTTYEKGRLFSAALEARGENYKKYIRYNKIVEENRDELKRILIEDVKF